MATLRIDLYSDTQTRPTEAMREAMARAPVGDEQRFEDPSVKALVTRIAELLGKEDAVFLPSGTMCNQIAAVVHCEAGDEIIADRTAHILNSEAGGQAVLARATARMLDGVRGVYSAEQLEAVIRPPSRYAPRSRMVTVEQTANLGGGTVWPLETMQSVAEVAKRHGLILHMDGARLLNAVVASGVAARTYCEPFDSVWLDFSKGLGCPVGAILAGPKPFIEAAWRWKQRIGGAMRQSGVLAAAALHALDHHVDRLAEDHANAKLLAERLAQVPGLAVAPETVDTNIVLIDVSGTGRTAHEVHAALMERGVRIGALDDVRLRALTHLDVSRAEVAEAADIFAGFVTSAAAA